MNVAAYIESGILEAYVFGALSPEEQNRVEEDVAKYPELAAEVLAIEETMFALAKAGAKAPPALLKEQILGQLASEHRTMSVSSAARGDNVRSFVPSRKQPAWPLAAAVVLLLASMVLNFLLWSGRDKAERNSLAVQQRMDTLQQQQEKLAGIVANYRKEQDMMADTGMQPVVMKSMQPEHPMAATVYWSRNKGEAWLAIQKMPPPPAGKQYQMWVIQAGKPVSMGVLANDMMEGTQMSKLPMQVTDGQAFAISLEKEGGVASPTMDQIQVMGKIPS